MIDDHSYLLTLQSPHSRSSRLSSTFLIGSEDPYVADLRIEVEFLKLKEEAAKILIPWQMFFLDRATWTQS